MQKELPSFSALVVPATPLTWEVSAELDGDIQQTERIAVPFPDPVEILGMRPTVIVRGVPAGGALRTPTTDDIAVLIDINQQRRITNTLGRTTVAGAAASFVTLTALSTDHRWLREVMSNASPEMGLTFRWKNLVTVQLYEDCIISLAFFCRFLDQQT